MTPQQREGYVCEFIIPSTQWSGTDTIQTERERARKRRWVKGYALQKWRELKKEHGAWRVDRFIAMIGVACPTLHGVVPGRAAETVKPIIDAGTKAGLWEDDDATRRCSTIYFQQPETSMRGEYRLLVYIFPVPDNNPLFQITGGIGVEMDEQWKREKTRPEGYGGYMLEFAIPHRQWLSSNINDSEMKARAQGKTAKTWGRKTAFGIREKVTGELQDTARVQWATQDYWGVERFIVLAGIQYPYGVGKDEADPDNCAESVNAILELGREMRAWRGLQSKYCKATVYFRVPGYATGGTHGVQLYVIPVPDGFQLSSMVADATLRAWREYDRRRR